MQNYWGKNRSCFLRLYYWKEFKKLETYLKVFLTVVFPQTSLLRLINYKKVCTYIKKYRKLGKKNYQVVNNYNKKLLPFSNDRGN